MAGAPATARDLLKAEGGFTLLEMLVAAGIGLLVFAGAIVVFMGALGAEPQVRSQAAGVQQARFVIERLTRELREGSTISTATASQLSLVTYVDNATCGGAPSATATRCQVTYMCTAGICTRAVSDVGVAGGAGNQIVSGLSSSNIFSYSPSPAAPTFVGVTLAFPGHTGDNAITLSDGVALRNSGP